ncbi:ParB-like protein [Paraburkholderia phymatum]|nr:ParB-like protein [Paraburkholderia phymatum]
MKTPRRPPVDRAAALSGPSSDEWRVAHALLTLMHELPLPTGFPQRTELEDEMRTLEIDALRPTQGTHGRREVEKKADAYRAMSEHDLAQSIRDKPVPIVNGPASMCFATDHHHVAAALKLAGIGHVPVIVVADLSSLSESRFWVEMENNHWVHPFDAHGRRMAFRALPQHVWESQEDDFRDLAAAARDAGGYVKTDVPLAEFRWAAFFRRYLPAPTSESEYQALIPKAAALARTELALGLPGFEEASASAASQR